MMKTESALPSGTSSSLWNHRVFQHLFQEHALSLFGSGLFSLALGLLAHSLVGASASQVLGIWLDGFTFLASAALIIGLPRLASEHAANEKQPAVSVGHGLKAMFHPMQLRQSLYLALQTSIAGTFVIVSTVDPVKNELRQSYTAYAWIMGRKPPGP